MLKPAPFIHKTVAGGLSKVSIQEHHSGYGSSWGPSTPLSNVSQAPRFPFDYHVAQLSENSRPFLSTVPQYAAGPLDCAMEASNNGLDWFKKSNKHPDWYYKALHPSCRTALDSFGNSQEARDLVDFGVIKSRADQPTFLHPGGQLGAILIFL